MQALMRMSIVVLCWACLNQRDASAAGEGVPDYKRYCAACDLKDDPQAAAGFRGLLASDVTGDLIAEFRKSGMIDLEIYLLQNRLFLIVETEPEFNLEAAWPRWTQTEAFLAWGAQSAKFLSPLPQATGDTPWLLLWRAYELEQSEENSPIFGYPGHRFDVPTRRFVDARQLVNDPKEIQAYIDHHAMGKAWPEITKGLKAVGIVDLEIYMVGNRTYKIHEVNVDFDPKTAWKELGQMPRSKEWGELVGSSDRRILDRDGNPLPSQVMERIFSLKERE